ncbi:helix-turn-helix transcriptional regulator [Aromatoleum aromaticum]|nr:helix-turn-helix domain-containing protein [Aromatoleum aromaticum]
MAAHTPAITLLTNDETAALIGISPETLPVWRVKGKGPAFRKIGRLVRYSEAEVLAWLDSNSHTSTSQYPTRLNPSRLVAA